MTLTKKDMRRLRKDFGEGDKALEPATRNLFSYPSHIGEAQHNSAQSEQYQFDKLLPFVYAISERYPTLKEGETPRNPEALNMLAKTIDAFQRRVADARGEEFHSQFERTRQSLEGHISAIQVIGHKQRDSAAWHNERSNEGERLSIGRKAAFVSLGVLGIAASATAANYGLHTIFDSLVRESYHNIGIDFYMQTDPTFSEGYTNFKRLSHGVATAIAIGVQAYLWHHWARLAPRRYVEKRRRDLIKGTTENLMYQPK